MKLKLAIIFGIVIWVITFALSSIFNPIFTDNLPNVNIIVPLITIVVTGFFGILYIRTIETNEVIEGILVGIVFVIIDIILDNLYSSLFKVNSILVFGNYPMHIFSTAILTILITTFLGYLAQMTIDLK